MRNKLVLPEIDYSGNEYPHIQNTLEQFQLPNRFYRYGAIPDCPPFFHTFVDDWKLEAIWRDPDKMLKKLAVHPFLMAPDFTIEKTWPYVQVLYNVWRSRVIARWWMDHGIPVIPVLQWASPQYYGICFDGLQHCEVVAVRGPEKETEGEWLAGAEAYLNRNRPKLVLHFGRKGVGNHAIEMWPEARWFPLNPRN